VPVLGKEPGQHHHQLIKAIEIGNLPVFDIPVKHFNDPQLPQLTDRVPAV
jgi:hypothetical protein